MKNATKILGIIISIMIIGLSCQNESLTENDSQELGNYYEYDNYDEKIKELYQELDNLKAKYAYLYTEKNKTKVVPGWLQTVTKVVKIASADAAGVVVGAPLGGWFGGITGTLCSLDQLNKEFALLDSIAPCNPPPQSIPEGPRVLVFTPLQQTYWRYEPYRLGEAHNTLIYTSSILTNIPQVSRIKQFKWITENTRIIDDYIYGDTRSLRDKDSNSSNLYSEYEWDRLEGLNDDIYYLAGIENSTNIWQSFVNFFHDKTECNFSVYGAHYPFNYSLVIRYLHDYLEYLKMFLSNENFQYVNILSLTQDFLERGASFYDIKEGQAIMQCVSTALHSYFMWADVYGIPY